MSSDNEQKFVKIMIFYMVLSCIVFPYFAYKGWMGPLGQMVDGETKLHSAGNGFILGSVITILLWLSFGKNMITEGKY